MAITTDPTYQVRQGLVKKGVSPSDIGYKNGYVTVSGQNFMQPSKVLNGVSYDSQQNFNNAWDSYQKAKTQPATSSYTPSASYAPTTATPTVSQYNPYSTNNPYDTQYNDLLSSLLKQSQQPQQVSVGDVYNSPQYAAYQAQAQRDSQAATRAAQESMGASGFGRSTALAERAQGIQNDANNYLQTQVLPQLIAQQQNERQQQLQNQLAILGQLQSAQGTYDTRYNNAQDLALQKGQVTGNYVDPAISSLIGQILQQKQNYGSATDAMGRQQASTNADSLRSQLAAMGVDPSLFGANQTLAQAQANMSNAGSPTLAAQQQQFNQDTTMAELTGKMPDGTPTNAYQQQQLANLWTVAEQTGIIPNELADMYGLPRGTQTQAAKQFALNYALDQKQTNASVANMYADNARQDKAATVDRLQQVWKNTGVAPAGLEDYGIKAGTPYPSESSGEAPTTRELESTYISRLNNLSPEKRSQVFKNDQAAIVNDLGIEGFNRLYSQYFDDYGKPKQ